MSLDQEARVLVGEYVLGLLGPEANTAVERRMEIDPDFRNAVEQFATSMHALDQTAKPESVPGDLWGKIEANLKQYPLAKTESAENVIDISRFWRSWHKAAIAASLLLGLGIGFAGGWFISSTPEPVVLVVLDTENNTPGAVFEAFADNSVRVIPLQNFEVPEGKILQVWTLYNKDVGPVSLGTLSRAETARLGAQPLPVPVDNQLYEITLEPAPGSPTGKPTGPILVKGFAKRPAI